MRTSLMICVALLLGAARGTAQRTELTGVWAAVPNQSPSVLPPSPGPVFGAMFGLRLEEDTVWFTTRSGGVSVPSTLPLDGRSTTTPLPGRLCEGDRLLHQTATFQGDALVITIASMTPAGGGPPQSIDNRAVLRLEGPDRLVVESTLVRGGERRQVGSVYVRSDSVLPPPRPDPPTTGVPATIDAVSWIGAHWAGAEGATTTEERWTPPASGGMMATARTLRGTALASFEFLCIVEREGSLAYLAMPNARMPPTVFTLTAVTATSATFENPSHDYPQVIRYSTLPDGSLETTIAGAGGAGPHSVLLRRTVSPP